MDMIRTIHISHAYDITLEAQVSSHYVCHIHKLGLWNEFHQYILGGGGDKSINLLGLTAQRGSTCSARLAFKCPICGSTYIERPAASLISLAHK
jgi:hypothetical protein